MWRRAPRHRIRPRSPVGMSVTALSGQLPQLPPGSRSGRKDCAAAAIQHQRDYYSRGKFKVMNTEMPKEAASGRAEHPDGHRSALGSVCRG